MLWFQPMPWGRWALVLVVAVAAAYIELKPDATVDAPFATATIYPGDTIDETNTELREAPIGLLDLSELGEVATVRIEAGAPVLASSAGQENETVPPGWWVIAVTLPDGAEVGDDVRLVLLDSGRELAGVVAHSGSDDPFAAADGGVAVAPESASDAALASSNGRLAVLISTG